MKHYAVIHPRRPGADLDAALSAVEARYGAKITLHDSHGLLYDRGDRSLLEDRHCHRHPYCFQGRFDEPDWDAKCKLDCAFKAESAAARDPRPFRKVCWKGVWELVVPTRRDKTLLLLTYAGPFRPPDGAPPAELSAAWRQQWRRLPAWDEARMTELARELSLLMRGVLHYAESAHGDERPTHRRGLIRKLLDDRADDPALCLADVCDALNLSPSRVNRVINHHFGVSFHKLLETERMSRARHLLESTELPMKSVANRVGYRNEYYFNRAFVRHTGMPPGKYRQSMSP